MSDSQTQSCTPTRTASRKTSVWAWAVALLIAIGLLIAAVVWAGGIEAVSTALGLGHLSWPSFVTSGYGGSAGASPMDGQTTVTTVTAPASRPATTGALPPAALDRMFDTQIASADSLSNLVAGHVVALTVGTPQTRDDSATVPLRVKLDDGFTHSADLTLARYGTTWYVFGLESQPHPQQEHEASSTALDMGVVGAITQQQAEAGTQETIVKGLLGGGFREVKVDSVQSGPRTSTIDVTLSGGSDLTSNGRIVLLSKTDAGMTYWFVASFEKR